MRVLLAGVGGVGEAIARIIKKKNPAWFDMMVLADYNLQRAQGVAGNLGDAKRFVPEQLDAGNQKEIEALAGKYRTDLIMNACSPQFNMPLFHAAYQAANTYIDMAMSLSEPHPAEPFARTGVKLGDKQFAEEEAWKKKGLLALLGSGVEPGMVNVFARYGADHLFDTVEEFHVRDGANLEVEGADVAFGFSIWTTIEECLNPPVVWEKERGWYTTEPFSDPEFFDLPEGIGPVKMMNVEHEEVLMLPRYFEDRGLRRVTFKFGLEDSFVDMLKTLQALGLDKTDKVKVGGVEVSPRDVVGVTAPDPTSTAEAMYGKTAAGLWIKGKRENMDRQVYIYQVADNQECMKDIGSQAVVAQTAFNPVIMMELLAEGLWSGSGVVGPEYFPAEPFLERMEGYGFPAHMVEMDSEYKQSSDDSALFGPLEQAD
ncbi:MAG: saccharopine dehydrogenase NADP-binding domain-containing protein [Spirochaetales bacterium]|nr:saccharopine dehydrogenase NADP-binding domain-containing protein [Spirochaetales bacterium]MCF7939807.1 saccharopine dehydrogenase NADP-binding domain-containing protein [Spirochaetales bacterium]